MHSAQLCAGVHSRQAAGPVNAGVASVNDEDAVHIGFDFRRFETEVQQSCHAIAFDAMTMAHCPKRNRPLWQVLPRQGPI